MPPSQPAARHDDELDPPMDIKVSCKPCGGKFAMSDRGSRVLNALREWDKEHRHSEARQ